MLPFFGSAQEFGETRILGCILQNDEFGICGRHALSFQDQVGEIIVAAPHSQQSLDVAVDGFHHTETNFGAAVVQDSVQVIHRHPGEFLGSKREREPIYCARI